MSDARTLLAQGQLSGAIERLNREVKRKPTDLSLRLFLFELLAFAGDLERAAKQLDVVGHQDAEMAIGAEVYRQVLAAEAVRRRVFTDGATPAFLTPPPEYAALHLEAMALVEAKEADKARTLLAKALDLHPTLSGAADDKPFGEFEDSDYFLGPFLEVILGERYAWLPLDQVKGIEIKRPAQLQDLLWAEAKVEARGGELGTVFVPALYPLSSRHQSEEVRLGRRTEWLECGAGLTRGAGRRVFAIDGAERDMLEISRITFS